MNAAEHKAAAEEALAAVDKLTDEMLSRFGGGFTVPQEVADFYESSVRSTLAMAQVHATLATIPDPVLPPTSIGLG